MSFSSFKILDQTVAPFESNVYKVSSLDTAIEIKLVGQTGDQVRFSLLTGTYNAGKKTWTAGGTVDVVSTVTIDDGTSVNEKLALKTRSPHIRLIMEEISAGASASFIISNDRT